MLLAEYCTIQSLISIIYMLSECICYDVWYCALPTFDSPLKPLLPFSVPMVRHEHLHAVQSYLVSCVYIYIYIRIDHVCVCVSMYGLGFADRLVLTMPCDSHI